MTNTALIDGDIIAYSCAASAQDDFDGEVILDREGAKDNAIATAEDWANRAGCSKMLICFSDPLGNNFRKLLPGSYKENRTGHTKPELYWDVVDHMHKVLPTMYIPWLEGDDVIGIFLTGKMEGRSVAVSIDKDMKTLPGSLFNPHKDESPWDNTEAMADKYHLYQSLIGDSTDGYTGIPGVGPKKAEAILNDPHRLEYVQKTRKWKKGGPCGLFTSIHDYCTKHQVSYEFWLTQARFARILRRSDFDKERHAVKLWHHDNRRDEWLQLETGK